MMHPRWLTALPLSAFLGLLTLAGCGEKDNSGADSGGADDSSAPEAECTEDTECASWQICEAEVCEDGDRNNGLDEAEAVLWEQDVEGTLETPGDQDFFQFEAEGGEFIRISTRHLPEDTEHEELDTVVSLYSPTGQLHMQEDDHAVGSVNTYDTVMYAYLPDAGTWTMLVEDINGGGGSTWSYQIQVRETGGHTREEDAFDDPSYDLEVTNAGSIWAVGVALEEPGDVDYIELELPYEECPVLLRGARFTSGTDAVATVELYDGDDNYLLRREGIGYDGANAFYPEVNGQSAILAVSDAQGNGGEDYWTFIFVSVDERGYSWPQEEEDNGTPTFANELDVDWETNEWGNYGVALTWGHIDPFGDQDYFAVDVDEDMFLTIRGSSDAMGSLLDAEVEVTGPSGEVIATETSGSDNFPDIYNLATEGAGTYIIRVSAEDEGVEGMDHYYRMSIAQSDYELASN